MFLANTQAKPLSTLKEHLSVRFECLIRFSFPKIKPYAQLKYLKIDIMPQVRITCPLEPSYTMPFLVDHTTIRSLIFCHPLLIMQQP